MVVVVVVVVGEKCEKCEKGELDTFSFGCPFLVHFVREVFPKSEAHHLLAGHIPCSSVLSLVLCEHNSRHRC